MIKTPHSAGRAGMGPGVMVNTLPKPFILINIPKTGTRYSFKFVRNADLLSIARKFRMDDILLRHPRLYRTTLKWWWKLHRRGVQVTAGRIHSRDHHIFYFQLPASRRLLPVISCLREPLSWHASQYAYMARCDYSRRMVNTLQFMLQDGSADSAAKNRLLSFQKKHLGGENSVTAWRNASLEGYWRFLHDFRQHFRLFKVFGVTAPEKLPIGPLGRWALMFMHRDPGRLFAMPPEQVWEYFADKHWRRDLCQGWFLRFAHLQEDLRCIMLEHLGYDQEILDAAAQLTPARINVSDPARKERALQELEQKPQLREEILRSERIYAEHILPLAGNFRSD